MLTIIFHKSYYYLAVPLLWCLFSSSAFAGGETTRVSVDSSGIQGNAGVSDRPSISAGGRYVAFLSSANNLVAGDTNGKTDVFVHDRLLHQTTRVNVASNGAQSNNDTYHPPSLSADGRYVAFLSDASNLVAGDTNGVSDIFVHDRLTHQTTRVSVASRGAQSNGYCDRAHISADGRYVAFDSYASNLVAGDTNGEYDIFVHDRLTHKTTRVSRNSVGVQGNASSFWPNISADGRYVAFVSYASNLDAGDTNRRADIFVHDRLTHKTSRASIASSSAQSYDDSYEPSISADGRYVAFYSWASNLVADDTNGSPDVFVHDRLMHQTTRVSVSSSGGQGNNYTYSYDPSLSADGRYVAFYSYATNLVAGDTNNTWDVFVHDRLTRQTTRVSRNSEGVQGNEASFLPSISADGRYVAFDSDASNLVDGDTNGQYDIFVRDRTLVTAYNADLQIKTTQQPPSLTRNSTGAYTYTLTNHGPDTIYQARIVHLVSNGRVVGFAPSQGSCRRYATVSLCNLGKLLSGDSLTLNVTVKALRDPLSQQVSVSAAARADTAQVNNSVSVETPVTP